MAHMADDSKSSDTPDPEVTAKARRRRFTAKYKLRILREADALSESGSVGEMLRREGLYSSHLAKWRAARERGELAALAPRKRGRKPTPGREILDENRRLARENARLKKKLAQAEAIIDVQKKVAALMEEPLKTLGGDESGS